MSLGSKAKLYFGSKYSKCSLGCWGSVIGVLRCPKGSKVVLSVPPVVLLQKCLRLDPDLPVWVSKQRVLVTLTQSLSDVLNYGLFQPAFNGRAGKFLDEERLLKDYPLPPLPPPPSPQGPYPPSPPYPT